MKFLLPLAFCLLALAGCGGSSSTGTPARTLAGEYQATWVNVADAEDHGISSWTIGQDGQIAGNDVDVSGEFSYIVLGTTDASGNVNATTSRIGPEEVIALTGRLQFDDQGRLVGDLLWASTPPLTYRYTFTRVAN